MMKSWWERRDTNNSMNILFVSYHYWPPDFGGELLVSIERFESLLQRGHKVVVLTSGSPGFAAHEFSKGIEIFRSKKIHSSKVGRAVRRLLFPFWVLKKIQKMDFEILHLGGTGGLGPFTHNLGNWMICKAAKKKKARLVWVHSLADTETEMYSEASFDQKLRKWYLNQMNAIISVSPALHESVHHFYPGTSFCIPYGIRDDLFIPLSIADKNKLRLENKISKNQVVITFLGSVGARKGFDLLAEVFLELEKIHSEWILWAIGPYTKKDNQNIDENSISMIVNGLVKKKDKVHFWGRIDDRKKLATLLAISDIFVFPSRKEGFGIAPLEAMAAGVPVIISKIPGVTDLANIEGQTGFYIEVGDIQSLKSNLIKLGTNEDLRQKMGKAAHEQVCAIFGWDKYIDKWEKIYSSLLET